jgi:hypothetical protein
VQLKIKGKRRKKQGTKSKLKKQNKKNNPTKRKDLVGVGGFSTMQV